MHRSLITRSATRTVAAATAAVLALGSVVLAGPSGAAVAAAPSSPVASAAPAVSAAERSSDIALRAGAYGTRIDGGQLPADSAATALIVSACATEPGLDRENAVADVALPGVGDVGAVTSRIWTRKRGNQMHSYARNSTAEIVLSDSPLGTLTVRGVSSLSHAWHDGKRFRSETETSIGTITFTPPIGGPQEVDIPAPGQPVTVPGVARLHIGQSNTQRSAHGSAAWAVALRIKLIPTGTDVFVARSKAQALSGVRHGRFGGYSAGTEASVLGGVLTSGRNPHTSMPCQGTRGKTVRKDLADLDIGGIVRLGGAGSQAWAKRFANRSKAWTRGSVAGLSLGGGALKIQAVVGKATVTRKADGKLVRSAKGSRVGTIVVDGEVQELPINQTIEIPGIAKLEPMVVQKLPGGLKVVALRVSLLDGTGAVLDLGIASTTIRR